MQLSYEVDQFLLIAIALPSSSCSQSPFVSFLVLFSYVPLPFFVFLPAPFAISLGVLSILFPVFPWFLISNAIWLAFRSSSWCPWQGIVAFGKWWGFHSSHLSTRTFAARVCLFHRGRASSAHWSCLSLSRSVHGSLASRLFASIAHRRPLEVLWFPAWSSREEQKFLFSHC